MTEEKTLENENQFVKNKNGFVSSSYKTSIGVIKLFENETLTVIKELLECIVSKNAIVICDSEYNEYDLKNYILMLIKNTLTKYNLDSNLVEINQVDDEFEYDLKINKDTIITKPTSEIIYLYLEDDYFNENILYEKQLLENKKYKVEIIKGNIDEVIKKTNKNKINKTAIYTQSREKAYKYINLVHSENIYVNATLLNEQQSKTTNNLKYMYKNVMYQL